MSAINGLGTVGAVNLQTAGLDLESVLMAVQAQRAQLLEGQLRGQIGAVQAKNDEIAKMGEEMTGKKASLGRAETELAGVDQQAAATRSALDANTAAQKTNQDQLGQARTELQNAKQAASAVPANQQKIQELATMRDQLSVVLSRDPNAYTGLSWGWAGDDKGKSIEMEQRLKAAGLDTSKVTDIDRNGTRDAHGSTIRGWIDQLNARIGSLQGENAKLTGAVNAAQAKVDTLQKQESTLKTEQQSLQNTLASLDQKKTDLKNTVIELKAGIDGLKNGIDALTNSQQMDMLRLQSLSNKRNEAFDLMTNFVKKMQDNRSSILGNMR